MLRTLALRFAVALVAATLLLGVLVNAVNWHLDNRIADIDRVDVTVDTTPRPAEAGNYLVVGSDSRAFVGDDADALDKFGEPGGERADSILIAHVEPEEQQVLAVSIPRDTVVDLPGGGRSKIADVFNDGPQALIDVIGSNFDVPITHYLNVDFAGFDRIVDLVGPVTVHFNAPSRDRETGLAIDEPGCVPLDGSQALAYVRSRHFEENVYGTWTEDPTSDLGRIRRQQAFLRQLSLLARERIYSSPLDVPAIVDAALDTLQADREFGRDQILGFIDRFRDVDVYDPASVEMLTLPVLEGPSGSGLGEILVLDQPSADELLARLRGFGGEVLPSPTAVEEPSEPVPAPPEVTAPLPDAVQGTPGEPPTPICG